MSKCTVKSLISNVYKYYTGNHSQQNKSKGPSGGILKKKMEATGFCKSTVSYRVLREQKQLRAKQFEPPVLKV